MISIQINEDGTISIIRKDEKRKVRTKKGKSCLLATQSFVAIDIETTGLSPEYDEIIELSAVRYKEGKCIDSFSSLVCPKDSVDEYITELTGITNEMLSSAPALQEVLPRYIEFIGNEVIVGHNTNFDINFIYDSCEKLDLAPFANDFIDTMRIARRMFRELPNHKLDTIAEFLGFEKRGLHRALNDCKLTAECYYKMMMDEIAFSEAINTVKRKRQGKCYSVKDITAIEGLENPDSPLYGKICVFTGTLEGFTRKEAAQLVKNIGGECEDRVTKKTNYLILGNNDYCKSIKEGKSNKQKKAEKYIANGADLLILSESAFIDMLQIEN